jgi:predicted restriction endonuclease
MGQTDILEELAEGKIVWNVLKEGLGSGKQRNPKNVSRLEKGDRILVYLAGASRLFYGAGILSAKKPMADRYELVLRKESGSRGFNRFKPPIPFHALGDQLVWKPREGSVHSISEEDYDTVMMRVNKDFAHEKAKLERESNEREPRKTEPPSYGERTAKLRDRIFEKKVKKNYGYACAVCGKSRFAKNGRPETESAHIYPRERDGSNDFRNGIALCKLHHWAFENGLFSIRDDYSIIIERRIRNLGDYEEVSRFENGKIRLPKEYLPHPKFLKAHRTLHCFK